MRVISAICACLWISLVALASGSDTYRVYILNKDAHSSNPYLHNPFAGQKFVLIGETGDQQWLTVQPGGYIDVNKRIIPVASFKQAGVIQLYVDVHYSQEGPECYSLPVHDSVLTSGHITVWMSAQPKKSFSNDCDVYWHGTPPPASKP